MAAPIPYSPIAPTFQPAGSQLPQNGPQEMMANFDRMNQDQKAQLFQQHLQKGLQGMTEVLQQLPPDIQAKVPDPSSMADTDDKRTMWYQSVNQAINRTNMQQASDAGDARGVERMGLNDPKATNTDFVNAAENNAMDSFVQGFTPTKKVTKTVYPTGGLKDAIVGQESGGDYSAVGPNYTKADGSMADMSKGDIALGKYQIVPKFWFDKLGLDPLKEEDRKKFLADPGLQDKAFDMVLQDSLSQFGGDNGKVIANYYGGPKAAAAYGTPDGDKPQSAGMPSVNDYVKSVQSKIQPGSGDQSAQVVTEDANKTQEDVALEVLKQDPRLIDKMAPILKYLGKGTQDMEMLKLLQRQVEEKGKNRRADQANSTRKQLFEDKSDQSLFDDMNKAEIPVIGSTLKDINTILKPAGGLASVSKLDGTGYINNVLTPLLKSEKGVNMNSLLQRLYGLELKRISGVAVSDAEFNRYKQVFSTKGTNSAQEQMFALRSFVRAFRTQIKLAKAAYGPSWDRVAGPAGLDLPDIPDVPDAAGAPPEAQAGSPAAPAADNSKAAAAKAKYKLDY